jgi:hypothetical protein
MEAAGEPWRLVVEVSGSRIKARVQHNRRDDPAEAERARGAALEALQLAAPLAELLRRAALEPGAVPHEGTEGRS